MTSINKANVQTVKTMMNNVFPVTLRSGQKTEIIVQRSNSGYKIKSGKGGVFTKLGAAEINYLNGATFNCLDSLLETIEVPIIFVDDIAPATLDI